jgi:[protein-PII] uridylyltransferase
VDIAWAKVTTLGSSVVDLFGITAEGGGATIRDELEHDLYPVLPAPPPAKPATEAS